MRAMKRLVPAGLVLSALAGSVMAGAGMRPASPARRLGWIPAPVGACADAPAAPDPAAAPADERLGFSRYLPPGIDHYLSLMQAGRLWRGLVESRAVRRLAELPEVKTALDEMGRELDLQKLPETGRRLIELLGAAFDSEITLALPAETMTGTVDLIESLALGAVLFAPSPHPPDSPEGRLLAEKRGAFRGVWEASLRSLQVPTVVLAARVRDERRLNAFVLDLLEQGRRGFLEAVVSDVPPEIRQALEQAWTVETIGGVTLHRVRLRARDLVTAESLDASLGALPLPPGDRARVAEAARRLTLDLHVGFLGDYLTVVVAPDDRLVRQIVERFEGKTAETLAASASFARVRAGLSPDVIGLTVSDSRRSLAKFKELLGLVLQGLDPDFLLLMGAPPEMAPQVERLRQMAVVEGGVDVVRNEGVDRLDRGIRSERRTEYDPPPPLPSGPLVTPAFVPAEAAGYYAVQNGSWDPLWGMVINLLEQQKTQLVLAREQAKEIPDLAEDLRRQERMLDRLLVPIREKLVPSLRGEMAFVLGGTAPLAVAAMPDLQGVHVPTAAALVQAEDPKAVIEGFGALVRAAAEMLVESGVTGGGPSPLPVALVSRGDAGQEVHVLIVPGLLVEGFEPHLAVCGKTLVISSSFALTRKIRAVAGGQAESLVSGTAHRAMEAFLDPRAWEVEFLDGARVNAMLRTVADGILGAVGRDAGAAEDLEQVKRFVREILAVLECFRGHAMCQVREGAADVQREWFHVTDREAE